MSSQIKSEFQRFWELIVIVLIIGLFTNIVASKIELILDKLYTSNDILMIFLGLSIVLLILFYYKFSPMISESVSVETPLLWINEQKQMFEFTGDCYYYINFALKKFGEKYPERQKDILDFEKGSVIFHNLMQFLLLLQFGMILQTSEYIIDEARGYSNIEPIKEILKEEFKIWSEKNIPKKIIENNIFFKALEKFSIITEIPYSFNIIIQDDPFRIIINSMFLTAEFSYYYTVWSIGETPGIASRLSEELKYNFYDELKKLPKSESSLISAYLIMKISPKKWWWIVPIINNRGLKYWNWMQTSKRNFKGFLTSKKPPSIF